MKINFNSERSLQLFIIVVCVIILVNRFSSTNSCAQTLCPSDQPPLSNYFGTPQKSAWRSGTNVSVKYYDRSNFEPTDPAEVTAVSNSIRDWNNRGCSDVTFGVAQSTGVAWDGQSQPPVNEMWIVRDRRNGQLVRVGNYNTGMAAALLYMRASFSLQTSDGYSRVDNLAKHEASHSFGMSNCTGSNQPTAVVCSNSLSAFQEEITLSRNVI